MQNVDITFDIFYSEVNGFGKPPGFIPADDVIMDKRREKKWERNWVYIQGDYWERERERENESWKEGLELNELYKTEEKRMTIKNSKIYYCIL